MFLSLLLASLLLFSGCAVVNSSAVLPSRRTAPQTTPPQSNDRVIPPSPRHQASPASSSSVNQNLKRVSESYLGVRYRLGGTDRRGMDCSGFIWRVQQDMGLSTQRTTSSNLFLQGDAVTRRNLRVGDLCFFGPNGRRVNHVGIYMGDNRFIHVSSSRGVMYSSLDDTYWGPRIVGFRRVSWSN